MTSTSSGNTQPKEALALDPFEHFMQKSGCAELHYAVQECMSEKRDWRQCQAEVKAFRDCVSDSQSAYKRSLGISPS